MRYQVLIFKDLAYQMPVDPESRRRILEFVKSLVENPAEKADYTELPYYTKIVGYTAITFWIDDTVAEVTVSSIDNADRG